LQRVVTSSNTDILLLSRLLRNDSLFMACNLLACSNVPRNSLLTSQ
jgi:hypothetical protein